MEKKKDNNIIKFPKKYEIGKMKNKTFITAEIGINHNGDINLAKKLIKKIIDRHDLREQIRKKNKEYS